MTLQKFLFILCILNIFCRSNKNISALLKSENENTTCIQEIDNVSIDSLSKNKFKIKYNEYEGNLYVELMSNPNKLIKIGSYHNTLNQPPHEIKIQDLDYQNYAILIITNSLQVGISEDHLNVYVFNLKNHKLFKVCSFNELGKYSDTTGIDTISNIKLYDYKIQKIKNNNLDFKEYEIELLEYKPYKYLDELKNNNLRFKMIRKSCNFKL